MKHSEIYIEAAKRFHEGTATVFSCQEVSRIDYENNILGTNARSRYSKFMLGGDYSREVEDVLWGRSIGDNKRWCSDEARADRVWLLVMMAAVADWNERFGGEN